VVCFRALSVSLFLHRWSGHDQRLEQRSSPLARWLDHARRSYGYEQGAGIQRSIDSIQLERHFAEPADVRANPTAASAPWEFDGRFVEIRVVKWGAATGVATAFEKLAVHVDDVPRTCLLVKVVHVRVQTKRRSCNAFSSLARAKCAGFGLDAEATRRRME